MKTRVTYILSNIDKAIAFEWITENLDSNRFEISFILMHHEKPYLHQWLSEKGIQSLYIKHNGKKSYPTTFLKVFKALRKIKPAVIHTHLFDANLIGLFTGKILNIKKRIYTRHHSTYHHDNFPKAVKYDKWSNKMATKVVAISKNVRNVLVEKEDVPSQKIAMIPHGFDLEKFAKVPIESINQLTHKYDIKGQPTIGVISRYIKWKGIQYIIPAFKNILKVYPNAILVLANANGPDKSYIQELLNEIPEKNYREIPFEKNLFALYKLFDIYIHTPIDSKIEAFGQTYVEALASKTPSVFTLSGIANEFIEDKKNALVVPYKDSKSIESSILELLENQNLKEKIVENGIKSVKKYNLVSFVESLEKLYQ